VPASGAPSIPRIGDTSDEVQSVTPVASCHFTNERETEKMVTRTQPVCDRSGVDIPGDYAGPIRFTWDGQDYEVDLCESEADAFRVARDDHAASLDRLGQFVAVARPIVAVPADPIVKPEAKKSAPRKRAASKAPAKKASKRQPAQSTAKPFDPSAEDLVLPAEPESATNGNGKAAAKGSDVRAWALANGYNLPPRGRMPKAVTLAYEAAVGG
jgi:hypothetical protein